MYIGKYFIFIFIEQRNWYCGV